MSLYLQQKVLQPNGQRIEPAHRHLHITTTTITTITTITIITTITTITTINASAPISPL